MNETKQIFRNISATAISKYINDVTDNKVDFQNYMLKRDEFISSDSFKLGKRVHAKILTPNLLDAIVLESDAEKIIARIANNLYNFIRSEQKTKAAGTRIINKISKSTFLLNEPIELLLSYYNLDIDLSRANTSVNFNGYIVRVCDVLKRYDDIKNVTINNEDSWQRMSRHFIFTKVIRESLELEKFDAISDKIKKAAFKNKEFKKIFNDKWEEDFCEYKYKFTHRDFDSVAIFDNIKIDYFNKKVLIIDLKTTYDIDNITNSITKYNYDCQNTFYKIAAKYYIAENLDIEYDDVDFTIDTIFMFCGTTPPYKTKIYKCNEDEELNSFLKIEEFYKYINKNKKLFDINTTYS